MWFGVFAKAFYTLILWKWVLPSFKKSNLPFVFLKVTGLLLLCFFAEILVSWQYQVFSVNHMIHHPSLVIWLNIVLYLLITLVSVAIYFTRESFRSERLRREIIETQLTTELNFLHAQINPHFLFNTLNNLFSMAQRDRNNDLATSISMLSGLMRYMLYESKATRVSLSNEITHLNDFIGLARMRFSQEELQVNLTTEGDIENFNIAPMVLLTFVENAFKHGVRIEEKSIIDLSIKVERDQISFRCFNQKKEENKIQSESSGIGLENVKRRLVLLYPNKHHLEIIDNNHSFEVKLMLQS
jgi:LytS/YehU family sensor histidine kinase